ncbi:MAG TPA: hypothetical protein PLO62_09110 [Candidatus Hydrogenedentes bacterium]|nr:hypothetical protein [Candidatus Hydrogenedentota bacterium]
MDVDAPHVSPTGDPCDRQALEWVRTWPHWPELHDIVWRHGVNLAEADEYLLFAAVLESLVAHREEAAP